MLLAAVYGFAARVDFLAAMAALLGVLLFDTLPGLVLGVVVSIVLLVYRTSRPHVAVLVPVESPELGRRLWLDAARHADAAPLDDVAALRVEAGLFFANADHTRDAVRASVTPATKAVVLDCETAPVIDVSAAEMLSQLAKDLARQQVQLLLAKSVGQVRDLLQSSGVLTELGELYPTIDAAVAAARAASPSPSDDADGTAPG